MNNSKSHNSLSLFFMNGYNEIHHQITLSAFSTPSYFNVMMIAFTCEFCIAIMKCALGSTNVVFFVNALCNMNSPASPI